VQLNPIGKEEAAEKFVCRERKPAKDDSEEHYPKSHRRSWGSLRSRHTDFFRIIFQEFFLIPFPHGGRIGVAHRSGSLCLLGGTFGDGGGGTSLAHRSDVGVTVCAKK
jgi:hypothetical protein